MKSLKQKTAWVFDHSGLNRVLFTLQHYVLPPHVRAINYHDVPLSLAENFESQLRELREHYEPVGLDELVALQEGRWPHRRPGLLMTFDDGTRSHSDVVAPILERYDFPGWFMVPADFVSTPPDDQAAYTSEHFINIDGSAYKNLRLALSWDEVRQLDAKGHIIGCHTRSHRRLEASLDLAELNYEIVEAKCVLERKLEHEINVFTWVGGEEWSYSTRAARVIREAGFRYGFMTNSMPIFPSTDRLQLQRSNIEAHFPPELMRLVISGFYDMMYLPKRRRVNRLTKE
ncbi:MAG: polysaccharide deacetylase family protein [Candidatus Electrothrix sp. AW1]|nr:polysaccharide deacetylase family protein [Candidatus Electrothrix sp. AX1]MCI5181521.1 polysaccharide deacetylase family protein [Candidatus Electrothrix gigas]